MERRRLPGANPFIASGEFMSTLKFLGIAGSLRRASTNSGLLRAAAARSSADLPNEMSRATLLDALRSLGEP